MKEMYMSLKGRCSSLLMFLVVMTFAFSTAAQEDARVRPKCNKRHEFQHS
jgi:hypothetical protein